MRFVLPVNLKTANHRSEAFELLVRLHQSSLMSRIRRQTKLRPLVVTRVISLGLARKTDLRFHATARFLCLHTFTKEGANSQSFILIEMVWLN